MLIKTCSEYDKRRSEKYLDTFVKLQEVTMDTTLEQLSNILGEDVIIVIGQNVSGCDVVNLNEEVFTEWTW